MSTRFDITTSYSPLLGETRIDALFRREYRRSFTLQGAAEITTTDVYVRAAQHWASLSVVTYFFSEWLDALPSGVREAGVTGVRVQYRENDRVVVLRPERDATLAIMLDGPTLSIDSVDGTLFHELLREEWTHIAVLHLEIARPVARSPALCLASSDTLPASDPIRLVSR